VNQFLAGIALSISDFCAARAERLIYLSKWWIDAEKWVTARGTRTFAEIRAARKAAKP
jgi:hypothetical protein